LTESVGYIIKILYCVFGGPKTLHTETDLGGVPPQQ